MRIFYFAGFSFVFWYNYTTAQFKALKTQENAPYLVRKKIMQPANARHVVYVVVVLAFTRKRVNLL